MPGFLSWLFRAVGLIFIGFFLAAPRIRRNRWAGIRFSYTLADDEVWHAVHMRYRWGFLIAGLVCFWPIRNEQELAVFNTVLISILIGTTVCAWFHARSLYRRKYGTTRVERCGFFRYRPPGRE